MYNLYQCITSDLLVINITAKSLHEAVKELREQGYTVQSVSVFRLEK